MQVFRCRTATVVLPQISFPAPEHRLLWARIPQAVRSTLAQSQMDAPILLRVLNEKCIEMKTEVEGFPE